MNLRAQQFAWSPKPATFKHWTIVRGDNVEILTGRYKKQQGKVLKVYRKKNMVTVQGVNLKYKTVDDEEGQRRIKVAQKEFPVHVSNVSLVDPELK